MNRYWKENMLVIVLLALASCRSGPPQITIEGATAELSDSIVGEAMVSMNIVNRGGADILTGVKTNVPGASAFIHQSEGPRMITRDRMAVPAKGKLEYTMHRSHIMVESLPGELKEGAKLTLTLIFEKSGEMPVQLVLQKTSPRPMDHNSHRH